MSELDFFLDFQADPDDWRKIKMELPAEKKITKEGDKWVVRAESTNKILGKHKTKRDALAQLRAIEASKHGKGK